MRFHRLSVSQQIEYEKKAEYLIERGYVQYQSIYGLARKLYEKDKAMELPVELFVYKK